MDFADAHLVHTDEDSLEESKRSGYEMVQLVRGAHSSAVERALHTGEVVGSIPTVPTASDLLADMLANDTWRMDVESRFWPKVMKPLGWDDCWIFGACGHRSDPKRAYGTFKLKSHVTVRAHRLSYSLHYGASPGMLLVCHKCDTPACVNPLHLFLGTVQDNSDDMVAKGRTVIRDQTGEKNGAAKLTAEQVQVIRRCITRGESNTAIAGRFGVTHQLISRIRRGRSWGNVPMQEPYAHLRR